MSARCQITGRTVGFGKAVSHSHRRTRRRWPPNIQLKAYYLPSEDRRIKVRVSAQGIKVIDRDGHRGRRRAAQAGSARRTSRAKRAHRSERRRSCEHN